MSECSRAETSLCVCGAGNLVYSQPEYRRSVSHTTAHSSRGSLYWRAWPEAPSSLYRRVLSRLPELAPRLARPLRPPAPPRCLFSDCHVREVMTSAASHPSQWPTPSAAPLPTSSIWIRYGRISIGTCCCLMPCPHAFMFFPCLFHSSCCCSSLNHFLCIQTWASVI